MQGSLQRTPKCPSRHLPRDECSGGYQCGGRQFAGCNELHEHVTHAFLQSRLGQDSNFGCEKEPFLRQHGRSGIASAAMLRYIGKLWTPSRLHKIGHLEVSKAGVDAHSPHQRSRQVYYVPQAHAWPAGAHQLRIRYTICQSRWLQGVRRARPGPAAMLRGSSLEQAAAVMNGSRVPAGSQIRNTVAQGGRPSSEPRPSHSVWLAVSPKGVLLRLSSPLPIGARLPGICPEAAEEGSSALQSVSDSLRLPEYSLIRLPDGPCTAWWSRNGSAFLPDSRGL